MEGLHFSEKKGEREDWAGRAFSGEELGREEGGRENWSVLEKKIIDWLMNKKEGYLCEKLGGEYSRKK